MSYRPYKMSIRRSGYGQLLIHALLFMLAVALAAWIFYDLIDNYTLLRHCAEGGFCSYQLLRQS